jgi:hypothetical protein
MIEVPHGEADEKGLVVSAGHSMRGLIIVVVAGAT